MAIWVIAGDGRWLGEVQTELRALIAPVFAQARSRWTAFAHIGALLRPYWQQMTAWLDTPAGKARYKQRAAIIEPVFAGCSLAWTVTWTTATKSRPRTAPWAASHNLLKAIRARRRTHAPALAA